jgi:hypothetical protein
MALKAKLNIVPRVLQHPHSHPGRRCLADGHGRGLHEKAEVDEGAGEGAGGFFVVFFNDLQCFC